jgi:hypothetical protein
MNNDYLEKIYNEIKEVPYLINTTPKEEFPNCYYKGMKLISAFAKLGVPIRAKYAVFDWRKSPIPSNIIDLLSDDFEHTHFYVEAYINNKWRTLDPSIDSKSAKLGFRAVDFKGDEKTCFHLVKVFSDEEQIERFMAVNEEADDFKEYFEKMTPFLTSFNKWIEAERAKL